MAKTYSAIVENGTEIVLQMVPGEGSGYGITEPGKTVYPVTFDDFEAYQAFISGDPEDKDYVRNPDGNFSIVPWPEIPAVIDKTTIIANGIDMARITGLPNPTTVVIQGVGKYVVSDGEFEISYDLPGIIQLTCESHGYVLAAFVITAI